MTLYPLKTALLAASSTLILAACGGKTDDAAKADGHAAEHGADHDTNHEGAHDEQMTDSGASLSLADVVANETLRDTAAMARDVYRHPAETLAFFGLEPSMTVVEIWPGGGWYTDILAPYLASGEGKLIAAHYPGGNEYQDTRIASFKEKYVKDDSPYGQVEVVGLGAETDPLAPAGSADMVLTFRNVHNWMFSDYADKAFDDFYAALKPGGILGVVEHRLPEARDKADEESSGYVKESTVIALAEAAGFELIEKSEINANPNDTADHPFGVWTLPPASRQKARDGSVPEGFDPAPYKAVGESDRMTLKFRKPIDADGALLE